MPPALRTLARLSTSIPTGPATTGMVFALALAGCTHVPVPVAGPMLDEDTAFGITELEQMRDPGPDGDGLVSFLDAPDPALRARAAVALGRMANDATLPALRAALGDADATVRARVAFAIGIAADEGGGPALLGRANAEQDPAALAAMLEAAGRVASAPETMALCTRLAGDPRGQVREGALRGLLFLAVRAIALDETATAAVVAQRRDADATRRFLAVYVLSRAETPPASRASVLAALREALPDDDVETFATRLKALARMADATDTALFEAALGHADWRVRVEAAKGMAACGPEAADRLAAWVEQQVYALPRADGPLPLAAEASRAPAVIDGDTAREASVRAAEQQAEAEARQTQTTGHAAPAPGHPGAATTKNGNAASEAGPDTGGAAPPPTATPPAHPVMVALQALTPYARRPRVIETARRFAPLCEAMALLQHAGQRAAVLACDGPALRRKTLHAQVLAAMAPRAPTLQPIPPSAGQTMAPPLDTPTRMAELTRLARDGDPRVRAAALLALSEIDARNTAAPLRQGLREKDMAVVAAAADGIQRNAAPPRSRPDPSAVPALLAALARFRSDDAAETMIAILRALAAIGDQRAVPMARWARQDPNWTVRRAARDALTALGDKDAPPPKSPPPPRPVPGNRGALAGQTVTATVGTTKGQFTIALHADEAPINVANLIFLAQQNYFSGTADRPGLTFHRVVPGFVIQGGDPRGDGYGGPGYTVRCEYGVRRFKRGSVGIALAGRDTGGSQLFVTHAATPHLDGRFTVIGDVTDGMDVVDRITVGDRFTSFEVSAR